MSDMRFWYPASITQITSINDSFDSCILSVCYAGRNRNKSFISKEVIERAIPTMSYCPLVANYDVESDAIGGHDVDFVESDGTIKMVNLTDAIGVVPENPQWCWETKTDKDGVEREYLSTPAILWKRTPVYSKLKREGVSGQSMEINVKSGKIVDGLFEIEAFEFTAFCLLGDDIEPCFEGASVEMFSMDGLSNRLAEMMSDFKKDFSKVMAASADDMQNAPKGEEKYVKGGEGSLNMEELLQKYGLDAADVDFEISEDMSTADIEARLEAIREAKYSESEGESGEEEGSGNEGGEESGTGDGSDNENSDQDDEENGQADGGDEEENDIDGEDDEGQARRQFQLTGEQMRDGILDALREIMYTDEWGSWPRYCYTDYDPILNEVYAYDNEDWNLYGFKYTLNGDNIVIDFDSKTRKKIAFVDFENGEAQFSYKHMLDSANAKFNTVALEVADLREYKRGIEAAERESLENEVFAKFTDIADDERFKALRLDCSGLSIQDIEEKCFAIRGRNMQAKFSMTPPVVRIPVERPKDLEIDEPYGGIFVKYGIGKHD